MDLSEKIKHILNQKNISPSLFADEIGIQRSSISHILAGRNKPSLDIVQKIVKRFPDLGVNWIWEDQELPKLSDDVTSSPSATKTSILTQKARPVAPVELNTAKGNSHSPVQENVVQQKRDEKLIDRVLVFYSDGTFKEFKQQ